MSLHYGHCLLSIPGPSTIPERVLNAMHRPSPNIYAGELHDVTATLFPDLKAVARTSGDVAIYIGNGHAAWEGALANCFSKGDKILVLGTGRFAIGWGELAAQLGLDVELIDFGDTTDADPERVEERLRADRDHEIKALLTVQTDTASSVQNDVPALRKALDDSNHPALFMVDCIASLGCERHEMDLWGVDVMVAACQKGLMTPAGVAFVFFNEKASKARKNAGLVTSYWDWQPRANPDIYYQHFCGTAPTHHLYGLRMALDMLVHEEGIEAAWRRHETFARAYWAAIAAWGQGGSFRPNIENPRRRSRAVTTVRTGEGEGTRLRDWCEANAGVTLGIPLGLGVPGSAQWDAAFRIGHMGHLNVPMVMGTLGAMDAGLKALDFPHGSGALEAASAVIAAHR